MDTVLYGAAYYPEYMPYDRLDQDVQLMQKADINVVRVGESSWGLWEPEDGRFEFAWMDRAVEKLHSAGIRIVMGTPTYSIPAWMYKEHPEIIVEASGRRHHVLRNPAEHGYPQSYLSLLLRARDSQGQALALKPWDLAILEEK